MNMKDKRFRLSNLSSLTTALIGFLFGLISSNGLRCKDVSRLIGMRGDTLGDGTTSWKAVYLFRGWPRDKRLEAESSSQEGQDRTILDIFEHKRDGTFLDLAANHATYLSNSMALEQKYGWNGLCIEPNPAYASSHLHRRCRLVQAVVGPTEGVKVEFRFNGVTGGVLGFDNKESNKTNTHYTVSIAKILQDFGMPTTIDYLSLDIEGAEAWAFESFPWHVYTFQTLTVERPKKELRSMLQDNSYTFLCKHGNFGDELWVHPSLDNYAKVVANFQGRGQCRDKRR